ncbi:OmpA family protein [Oleomonas cavernae]|nr:OmpA family protein [Oleomonas cavernae]
MFRSKSFLNRGIAALPLCLLLGAGAGAQSRVDMRGVDPSQCDVYLAIGRALPPECQSAAPSTGVTTRGLGLDIEEGGAPGTAAGVAPPAGGTHTPPDVKEGVFTLQFALNSSVLTPQARAVLDKVAVVMNDPASAGAKFVVKGFTDASGSGETNMQLSMARARAARDYLVTVRGVAAASITAEGYGETQLLSGIGPNSPWHRRVEILADFRG